MNARLRYIGLNAYGCRSGHDPVYHENAAQCDAEAEAIDGWIADLTDAEMADEVELHDAQTDRGDTTLSFHDWLCEAARADLERRRA